MTGSNAGWAYRGGIGVAAVTSFLTVWTTIVRDDGHGMSYFMVIMAWVVGGFAAWFRPAGMARTMLGVAVMQALLGVATATAPVVQAMPDGSSRALLFNGAFTVFWLVSAAFFRAAAKRDQRGVAAH